MSSVNAAVGQLDDGNDDAAHPGGHLFEGLS